MSVWVNVNGVQRELWESYSKIDGAWRPSESYSKVNGIWKRNHNYYLTENDIIGFRMVYKLSYDKKHPKYPHLSFNNKIPVEVNLTGSTRGFMDTNLKGIIFRYLRDEPDEEGILMYQGHLYAILTNEQPIDIGLYQSTTKLDDMNNTSRLDNLSIKIRCRLTYESYGYYMAGWNSMFSDDNITGEGIGAYDVDYKQTSSYNMLPVLSRGKNFCTVSSIGIARDMKSPENNMIGSYGTLYQSINGILVNGIEKPFTFEVYN